MSVIPPNKTVPQDKDIVVSGAKLTGVTSEREQLSVVLDNLDVALQTEITDRIADVDAEETRALAAEAALDQKIDQEIQDRINDVDAEETARIADVDAEETRAIQKETSLQNQVDGERSPLRVSYSGTTLTIASALGSRIDSANNTIGLSLPNGSFQSDFTGGTINFATGVVTNGISFTPIDFQSQMSKWAKYAVILLPTIPNSLLVIPGDTFASTASGVTSPAFDGGVPIAIIAVQDNGSGSIGTIEDLASSGVIQLLASGSGSAGSGSGSPLDPLETENFVYYTRSDFSVDKKSFFGSTTGSDQILGLKKLVLNSGNEFISSDLTGTQVHNDAYAISHAQVKLLYASGNVDENPTIQVTRDGGLIWKTASITLPGSLSSGNFEGNIIIGDAALTDGYPTHIVQTTTPGATLISTKYAVIVRPNYRMTIHAFNIRASTSATLGTITGKVYTAAFGMPQTLVQTSQIRQAGQDITSTAADHIFTISPITLEPGQDYAFAIEGSGLNGNLFTYTASVATTSATISSASATTGGYSASANIPVFGLKGSGCDLRVKVTSSQAGSEVLGFGVNYVVNNASLVAGVASYEERVISASEASTGLITLQSVRYTPGARQLMMIRNKAIWMAPDFTEIGTNAVKFTAGALAAGDTVRFYNAYGLVDGSSLSLGKINTIFDAVVGSASQVASGYANYSSLQDAINAVAAGSKITLLSPVTESITLNKQVSIEGKGYGTLITGTFAVSASYATVRDVRFGGNVTLTGSGNFIRDSFIVSTATVSDTGTANSKLIISE